MRWLWLGSPFLGLAIETVVIWARGRGAIHGDEVAYLAMAGVPGDPSVPAPYRDRVLSPQLVHWLPGPHEQTFWLLTIVSLALAVAAVMWTLAALEIDRRSVVLGGFALVSLGPATAFHLNDYALVDPLAIAIIAFAVGTVVRRHGALLIAAMVMGATAKETTLLALPFAILLAAERRDGSMLRWSAGAAVAAVAVLVTISRLGGGGQFFLASLVIYTTITLHSPQLATLRLLAATSGTWGLLTLAIARYFGHSRAINYTLLLASLQVFAGDPERSVAFAAPVAILAAALSLESTSKSYRLWWWIGIIFGDALLTIPFSNGDVPSAHHALGLQQLIQGAILVGAVLVARFTTTRSIALPRWSTPSMSPA